MDIQSTVLEFKNRINKRWQHLSRWLKASQIQCFRLYDRDISQFPFIIDGVPGYWVVWECDHTYKDQEIVALMDSVKIVLQAMDARELVIKYRKKDVVGEKRPKDHWLTVEENGLLFDLNLTRYLDIGLFYDHRNTRDYVRSIAKGKRVLNLFAYTGSFSCYALKGGAQFVMSVDMNPRYTEWHERNAQLNACDLNKYKLVTQDARVFLARNKRPYDIIICDPPSFSQSKRTKEGVFQIQTHGQDLIQACLNNLTDNGVLIFSTNYRRFNMDAIAEALPCKVKAATKRFCPKDFEGLWHSQTWLLKGLSQSLKKIK